MKVDRDSQIATSVEDNISLPEGAQAVARGVARMFLCHDILMLQEVTLRNHRRADLMGLDAKGNIIIVEIKVARGDLLGDQKWTEYLDYCDRFYWAIPPGFEASPLDGDAFLPDRSGIIIADAYDGEIIRPAATHPLAAARRKVETLRLARRSMQRLVVTKGWVSPFEADKY